MVVSVTLDSSKCSSFCVLDAETLSERKARNAIKSWRRPTQNKATVRSCAPRSPS